MDNEDRKILTGFLGECWHEEGKAAVANHCIHCGLEIVKMTFRTFDTWEDFGALWEKICEDEEHLELFLTFISPDPEKHYSDFSYFPAVLEKRMAWEQSTAKERCLLVLHAIKEGVL